MLFLFQQKYGTGIQVYYDHILVITGICNVILTAAALFCYKKDSIRRAAGGLVQGKIPVKWQEGVWLLFIGAGVSHMMNLVMAVLQLFLQDTTYQENMGRITEGKSFFTLVLVMGIIGPLAEELIFRWLLYLRLRDHLGLWISAGISGLLFGIYHGNLFQGIYATILGMGFAWIFECTGNLWSSVLLHIGANVWSLVFPKIALPLADSPVAGILILGVFVLFGVTVAGLLYFAKKKKTYPGRRI
mgnify:CR=1 FL=1